MSRLKIVMINVIITATAQYNFLKVRLYIRSYTVLSSSSLISQTGQELPSFPFVLIR